MLAVPCRRSKLYRSELASRDPEVGSLIKGRDLLWI
jgi:hypothetical protein